MDVFTLGLEVDGCLLDQSRCPGSSGGTATLGGR